ncbi:MAG: hypothetical protein DRO76_06005, partial [Candidatus Altiarchaeales archaeon]
MKTKTMNNKSMKTKNIEEGREKEHIHYCHLFFRMSLAVLFLFGITGVASAFHAGVIPHADLIQSYTSSGGTPEYKDSDTDLVYKVQQGDTL